MTRALKNEEIEMIKLLFDDLIEKDNERDLQRRNYTLMFTQIYTGFRISEILSLKVRDVLSSIKKSTVGDTTMVCKKNMKGKKASRTVNLNEHCKELLNDYIVHYRLTERMNNDIDYPLFFSSRSRLPLKVRQCQKIYKEIFRLCDLDGIDIERSLSTHSMRKTFAEKCYSACDKDILILQQCMGHANLDSTSKYIKIGKDEVKKAANSIDLSFIPKSEAVPLLDSKLPKEVVDESS